MANVVRIHKIEYNRDVTKIGDIQAVDFEAYERGKQNVSDIHELRNIDKSFYRIYFKDGTFQDIFNVSRVYWEKEQIKS